MSRQNRIAWLIAAVLVVAVSGTVLATRQAPSADTPAAPAASGEDLADEGPPDASAIAHAADRLSAHRIAFDEAVLTDLAARYGIGGAVRLVVWAGQTGKTIDQLTDMRDGDGSPGSQMGWGQIAHELHVSPGIGAVMGGGKGQAGDADEGEASGD
jgi:hypothetical protein